MNQKPGTVDISASSSGSNHTVPQTVPHSETNGNTTSSQVHILSASDIELPVVSQASDLLCLDT